MMESLGRILTRLLKSVLDLPPAVAPAAQKANQNAMMSKNTERQLLMKVQTFGPSLVSSLSQLTYRRGALPLPKRRSKEPIIGWRGWCLVLDKSREPALCSVVTGTVWEGPVFREQGPPTTHPDRVLGAVYGIHAAKMLVPLEYKNLPVEGEIMLSGRVIVHRYGYRAEVATIRRLVLYPPPWYSRWLASYGSCPYPATDHWPDEELRQKLADRYQCDVEFGERPDYDAIRSYHEQLRDRDKEKEQEELRRMGKRRVEDDQPKGILCPHCVKPWRSCQHRSTLLGQQPASLEDTLSGTRIAAGMIRAVPRTFNFNNTTGAKPWTSVNP